MKIIKHSFLMIKKTYKNYLLLSVTAFLSFAIMFGYLMFTDSESYNKYNELFSESPNVILSYNSGDQISDINILTRQLDKMPNTHYYYIKSTSAKTSFGHDCAVNFLPSYVWGMYAPADLNGHLGMSRLKINDEWDFSLGIDEAIVSEQVYQSIKADKDGKKRIQLVFTNEKGFSILKTYYIVGSYSSNVADFNNLETSSSFDPVYVNIGSINAHDFSADNIVLTIYTERMDFVIDQIKKLNLSLLDVYTDQNTAIVEKTTAISNKYIIAAVLFILLGINLYSSFTNTLNDRKFEIGVKRALGASKLNIMLQFVIEGFAVMLANIALSVCVIVYLMNTYKFFKEFILNEPYIVTIHTESILLYVIFVFFLTLIFSLLFAYQSTKIEIVKYLKEEL